MRTELFSPIEPYNSGMLTVDDRHSLYWEESGNSSGVPVLFLHGGPGAGASVVHRRFFDPDFYRIVIFDQRGSGRSTPLGELRDNTTADLIADIEKLRAFLRVESWMVFGGSWGATLAIAYGEAFPGRCLGFVLRGIFLSRPSEIDWFLYGVRTVFPEAWRAFSQFLPESERTDLLSGYYRRLIHSNPKIHLPAARAWCQYEGDCSTLLPKNEPLSPFPQEERIGLALARIEAHYFTHRVFLPNNDLLAKINRLRRHPCHIVQGRYDMICPLVTADDLARAWPEANYLIVPDAGHSALEPGISAALIGATERFREAYRIKSER